MIYQGKKSRKEWHEAILPEEKKERKTGHEQVDDEHGRCHNDEISSLYTYLGRKLCPVQIFNSANTLLPLPLKFLCTFPSCACIVLWCHPSVSGVQRPREKLASLLLEK